MKQAALYLIAGIFLAVPAASVLAHATGVSYQVDIDGYSIDVGYSAPAPQAGESVLFDFRLFRQQTEDVPFTDVWVKVENASKAVVFAGGIYSNPLGGARMSYAFAVPGTYTVSIRYEDDATSIVESSFPITVLPASVPFYRNPLTYLIALAVLEALIAVALVLRARRR